MILNKNVYSFYKVLTLLMWINPSNSHLKTTRISTLQWE